MASSQARPAGDDASEPDVLAYQATSTSSTHSAASTTDFDNFKRHSYENFLFSASIDDFVQMYDDISLHALVLDDIQKYDDVATVSGESQVASNEAKEEERACIKRLSPISVTSKVDQEDTSTEGDRSEESDDAASEGEDSDEDESQGDQSGVDVSEGDQSDNDSDVATEDEASLGSKATFGMIGGAAGGGLFALTGAVVFGAPVAIAAAAASVPVALGGLSGTAVGAGRETRGSAFLSGALAGFVGPSATALFIGGELASKAGDESQQEQNEADNDGELIHGI